MTTGLCPWCDKPKKVKRNATCGDAYCRGMQTKKTKTEKGNFNYTERPFGFLIGTKVAKPFSAKSKLGGKVVTLCGDCIHVVRGRCRFYDGDLNNNFRYGKDCGLKT